MLSVLVPARKIHVGAGEGQFVPVCAGAGAGAGAGASAGAVLLQKNCGQNKGQLVSKAPLSPEKNCSGFFLRSTHVTRPRFVKT